jgi:hypothetical protein
MGFPWGQGHRIRESHRKAPSADEIAYDLLPRLEDNGIVDLVPLQTLNAPRIAPLEQNGLFLKKHRLYGSRQIVYGESDAQFLSWCCLAARGFL